MTRAAATMKVMMETMKVAAEIAVMKEVEMAAAMEEMKEHNQKMKPMTITVKKMCRVNEYTYL
jgi:hypothetical protein